MLCIPWKYEATGDELDAVNGKELYIKIEVMARVMARAMARVMARVMARFGEPGLGMVWAPGSRCSLRGCTYPCSRGRARRGVSGRRLGRKVSHSTREVI